MSEIRVLDAGKIVQTVARLRDRVAERFPDSGLAQVAADLTVTAQETAARVAALSRPYLPLRVLAGAVVILGVAAQIYVGRLVDWAAVLRRSDVVAISQGLDSAVNLLLLAFAAIWFVLTLEARWKRRAVLQRLYELRSFAHVIDMHQLTKDPTYPMIALSGGAPTASSPMRRLNEFELSRYLDYCTELLALVAKLAALYAARVQDPAVITAVNEVEELTSDLGRKIWQKIMIISRLAEQPGP